MVFVNFFPIPALIERPRAVGVVSQRALLARIEERRLPLELSMVVENCSNSPGLGSGMPNHYVGDLLPIIEISGLSRVRTELF